MQERKHEEKAERDDEDMKDEVVGMEDEDERNETRGSGSGESDIDC